MLIKIKKLLLLHVPQYRSLFKSNCCMYLLLPQHRSLLSSVRIMEQSTPQGTEEGRSGSGMETGRGEAWDSWSPSPSRPDKQTDYRCLAIKKMDKTRKYLLSSTPTHHCLLCPRKILHAHWSLLRHVMHHMTLEWLHTLTTPPLSWPVNCTNCDTVQNLHNSDSS